MSGDIVLSQRSVEITTFYYLIYGRRIHEGLNHIEARKEASDAVTLRYGIGQGRLLNIISSVKTSRIVNDSLFKSKVQELIDVLREANMSLDATRARNDKLISLLKECLDEKA